MKKTIDEKAVWQRVTAAGGQSPWELPAKIPPDLTSALQEGAALHQGLIRLYRRTGNARFSGLARQQRQENLRLRSLHYLLTGEKPGILGAGAGKWTVKRLLEAQQKHLETLRATERIPGNALSRIIRAAEERFDILLELLGQEL